MSAYAPVQKPHRLLGSATTVWGTRAVRWLAWSFGLLVVAAVGGILWEASGISGTVSTSVGAVLLVGFTAAQLAGLAAGVAAWLAVRRGERALIVYAGFLPIIGILLLIAHPLFMQG
jgi:hypothetical protein